MYSLQAQDFGRLDVVKTKSTSYTVLEVPSSRDPDKKYRVDLTNGRCSCPAWKFSPGHRKACKHLKALGYKDREPDYSNL